MSNTSGPSVPEISGRLALRLLPSKVTVTLRFVAPWSAVLLILVGSLLGAAPFAGDVMMRCNNIGGFLGLGNAAPGKPMVRGGAQRHLRPAGAAPSRRTRHHDPAMPGLTRPARRSRTP
jgi:hypothetical protein